MTLEPLAVQEHSVGGMMMIKEYGEICIHALVNASKLVLVQTGQPDCVHEVARPARGALEGGKANNSTELWCLKVC